MSRPARASLRVSLWRQLPLVVWLVVLWVLLWDDLTILTVAGGVVVAAAVIRAFYLPAVELSGRFNIYWAVLFAVRFIADVVVASVQVAWQAVDFRRLPRNSIIAVSLRTRSDIVLTLTAQAISLVPGSFVVEVNREETVLYLHVLGTNTIEEVESFRQGVLQLEQRLVRALGSADDIRRINLDRAERGQRPIHRTRRQRAYENARSRS